MTEEDGKVRSVRRMAAHGPGENALVQPTMVARAYPLYTKDGDKGLKVAPLFKREYSREDIETAFARDEVANKLVRKLARDCVGKWFTLNAKAGLAKVATEVLDALEARRFLYRGLVHMLAHGRCALMLGTDKDLDIEAERPEDAKVLYLHAMHPRFVTDWKIGDEPKEKNYGEIASITIERQEGGSPVQKKVPRSRYIWMANLVTNDHPEGSSILLPIMDQLTVKKNLDWSVGESYFKNASPLYQLELPLDANDDEFDSAEDEFTDVSARTEFVTPNGYKIYLHGTQNAMSPRPYTEHNLKCISAGLDVPYQLLLGTAAGAVTGAEMNLKDYYQSVAVIQTLLVEPYVRELLNVLQGTGQIPEGPYKIVWNPLEEMSEKERAEIAKLRADALSQAVIALPKLLEYGLKCKFVDGRLVVEDGTVKKPEPKSPPAGAPPTSPPEAPSAPGSPPPPPPSDIPSLPPTKGPGPSGSPSESLEGFLRLLREKGFEVNTLEEARAALDQRGGSWRAERQAEWERYSPPVDLLQRRAVSDLVTGLHEAIDDLMEWLEGEVLKSGELDSARANATVHTEDPLLWQEVYRERDLALKVQAREIVNGAAEDVAQTTLDASYEAGYVQATSVLAGDVAAADPLRSEHALRWLKPRRAMFYDQIVRGSGEGIKETLLTGLERGWGVPRMTAELGKQLPETEARLETIVRTEVMRASSEGSLRGYKENGVQEVELLANPGACPECEDLDGTRYTVDEASGVRPIHPQCRCTWKPVVESMEYAPEARGV